MRDRIHPAATSSSGTTEAEPAELPNNGVLDLHMFRPADVMDLVPTYLEECRERGILHVRILHGKGIGALRETVHAVLKRAPGAASYRLAPGNAGGWGVTATAIPTCRPRSWDRR